MSLVYLISVVIMIFAFYKLFKKFNKKNESLNLQEIQQVKSFGDYLRGKDRSILNSFSLPRWCYLLIPLAISGPKNDVFGIVIGEIIFLVLLYILYFFNKRKQE